MPSAPQQQLLHQTEAGQCQAGIGRVQEPSSKRCSSQVLRCKLQSPRPLCTSRPGRCMPASPGTFQGHSTLVEPTLPISGHILSHNTKVGVLRSLDLVCSYFCSKHVCVVDKQVVRHAGAGQNRSIPQINTEVCLHIVEWFRCNGAVAAWVAASNHVEHGVALQRSC